MKTITRFKCEICGEEYNNEEDAIECEGRGKFDPSKFPIGTMFEYEHNGYGGVFAIGKARTHNNAHLGNVIYWACRTKGYPGDSLGEELCGGDLRNSDEPNMSRYWDFHRLPKNRVNSPEYKRMVEFLRSRNIQPKYYNEQKELITVIS